VFKVSLAVPVLLIVTVNGTLVVPITWLPKFRLVGERLTVNVAPVPVRLMVCGLPAALSVIVTLAVRLPLAVGVKVTLMVQLAPVARELPHVFVCTKSPLLVPVIAMLVRLTAVLPVLAKVTAWAVVVVPTF
jgi:hypothetical protein